MCTVSIVCQNQTSFLNYLLLFFLSLDDLLLRTGDLERDLERDLDLDEPDLE